MSSQRPEEANARPELVRRCGSIVKECACDDSHGVTGSSIAAFIFAFEFVHGIVGAIICGVKLDDEPPEAWRSNRALLWREENTGEPDCDGVGGAWMKTTDFRCCLPATDATAAAAAASGETKLERQCESRGGRGFEGGGSVGAEGDVGLELVPWNPRRRWCCCMWRRRATLPPPSEVLEPVVPADLFINRVFLRVRAVGIVLAKSRFSSTSGMSVRNTAHTSDIDPVRHHSLRQSVKYCENVSKGIGLAESDVGTVRISARHSAVAMVFRKRFAFSFEETPEITGASSMYMHSAQAMKVLGCSPSCSTSASDVGEYLGRAAQQDNMIV
eukprot:PhM_4_TR7967/c0_g1_i1/m.90428